MQHSSPIRQLTAACLTFCLLAVGVLLLDPDQGALRADPTRGQDLGGPESLPARSDLFEPGLRVSWTGEGSGEQVASDSRAFRNHGLHALNVDLVTGIGRH